MAAKIIHRVEEIRSSSKEDLIKQMDKVGEDKWTPRSAQRLGPGLYECFFTKGVKHAH